MFRICDVVLCFLLVQRALAEEGSLGKLIYSHLHARNILITYYKFPVIAGLPAEAPVCKQSTLKKPLQIISERFCNH